METLIDFFSLQRNGTLVKFNPQQSLQIVVEVLHGSNQLWSET